MSFFHLIMTSENVEKSCIFNRIYKISLMFLQNAFSQFFVAKCFKKSLLFNSIDNNKFVFYYLCKIEKQFSVFHVLFAL